MFTFSKFLRHVGTALALAAASLASHAAPTTQLGFLIDASGSIGTSNFNTMRSGYAAALAALPTDGSIEVTIYTFASGTVQVVKPTVIDSVATLNTVIASVNGMAYTGGGTDTAAGINVITAAMIGSSNFNAGLSSMVNIATDGVPNSAPAAITAATNAHAAGIDSLTAEFIGQSSGANFLKDLVFSPIKGPCTGCGTLLPVNSTPTDPMTTNPWVLPVNSFDDFPTAIKTKILVATGQVPEPGVLMLLAVGLVGMVAARRRSA